MIYLDNAATSWPKPVSVLRAAAGVQEKPFGNPGRGGHRASLCAGRVVYACREEAARYLNCVPEQVIFTLNCTDAINMALRGFLHRGDHVLISHDAHNAVMRPLCGMERRGEISLSVLRAGEDGLIAPGAVDEAVTPMTALCVITHASNVTGTLQHADELTNACHRYGIPVLLDAAQTAGTVDIAATKADLIAMPGHKGLLGPMGTGILYVADHMDLRPLREGGTGSSSESVYQPEMLPDRFESGTMPLPAIAGLLQGIRFVREHGADIHRYEVQLIDELRAGLENVGNVIVYGDRQAPHVGVLSFNIRGLESAETADLLDRAGFCLRGGLHCAPGMHMYLGTEGTVRASVGPFSTGREIDLLIEEVAKIAKRKAEL
ncbi:MAG: aminotransferase class V-fold PLP-dependent enzyme [Clostridia bacterium]|nr:aminotransferase class V-fold PLP-dependent enzyme [Clostridia bacterium]